MAARPGYGVAPTSGNAPSKPSESASTEWLRRVAHVVNSILSGKLNAVLSVTLAKSAASTTVIDGRIGAFSAFLFQPLTADAAALLYAAPYVLVASQQSGQATFSHANTANADLNFNLVIIG